MKEVRAEKLHGREELERRLLAKRILSGSCWNWIGTTDKVGGYGRLKIGSIELKTHRLSFHLYSGQLRKGMVIDHQCRNRKCFNPEHLKQVTPTENVLQNSESFAAKNKAKTHCKNGHPLSGKNLYRQPGTTFRYCRKCSLARQVKCIKKATRCLACGNWRVDVAHIKSRGSGGGNERFNIISLCRRCHSTQHAIGWPRFLEKNQAVRKKLDELGWEIQNVFGVPRLRRK